MLKIDWVNTWFLKEDFSENRENSLNWVLEKYKNWKLPFIDFDQDNDIKKINKFVEKTKDDFENVVILWIWWVIKWIKAIFSILNWKYYNELSAKKRKKFPKIYFLDDINPDWVKDLLDVISLKKTLFIVITKSWKTPETNYLYEFFKEKILKKDLDEIKHFVFVTKKDTEFYSNKKNLWFKVFEIPENVWWNFSIFSNAWLLPLAFSWIDIKNLLKWQEKYKQDFLSENLIKNLALNSAIIQFNLYKNENIKNSLFFPFSSNLNDFWIWYKKFFNEVLGQNDSWISMFSLSWVSDIYLDFSFLSWINNEIITFLEVEKFSKNYKIEENRKITFEDISVLEKIWVEKILTEKNIQNYTIKIDKIDEETIWELIFFFQMQICYLVEFFWLDILNQKQINVWKELIEERIKNFLEE